MLQLQLAAYLADSSPCWLPSLLHMGVGRLLVYPGRTILLIMLEGEEER